MLKDKRFIAVIVIALVVVVILDVRYFINRHQQRQSAPQATAVQPLYQPVAHTRSERPAARTADTRSAREHVAHWNTQYPLKPGARNPFSTTRTLSGEKIFDQPTEKTLGSGPRLGAIAMIDGKPVAIIDGEPVTEEDTLGDIRVIDIGHDQVTLARGGSRWRERLGDLPGGAPVYSDRNADTEETP